MPPSKRQCAGSIRPEAPGIPSIRRPCSSAPQLRYQFIASVSLTGPNGAASVGPRSSFRSATSSEGCCIVRVGSGSLQFELVENWEQLPKGWSHPHVAGVAADSSDNVFLYCRGDHPVIVYDRDGKFLDSWGEGKFSYRTHGAFMTQHDQLFLVDDAGI